MPHVQYYILPSEIWTPHYSRLSLSLSPSLPPSPSLPSSLPPSLPPLLSPSPQRDLGISSISTYFEDEDTDRVDAFEADLAEMKSRYYQEKLGFLRVDSGVLAEQTKCYVVGVQWVLSYYLSWSAFMELVRPDN